MIQELLDFADALELHTPTPFDRRPVPFIIDLDLDGKVLGISKTCGRTKSGETEKEKEFECPVALPLKRNGDTVQASGGAGGVSTPEPLVGSSMEIFRTKIVLPKGKPPALQVLEPPRRRRGKSEEEETPNAETAELSDEAEDTGETGEGGERKKNQYYRYKGWLKLHFRLFRHLQDHTQMQQQHRAFLRFLRRRQTLIQLLPLLGLPADPAKLTTDHAKTLKEIGDRNFGFRIAGKFLHSDEAASKWWDTAYREERRQLASLPGAGDDPFEIRRKDFVDELHWLTPVFPSIRGIPGALSQCPLASFDKDPFKSYGLDSRTLPMRLETAERAAAALNHLLRHDDHQIKLGNVVAVFWAVTDAGCVAPLDFIELFEKSDALEVRDFLRNIWGHAASPPQSGKFYCALLSSPKARITVRAWHDEFLPEVSRNVDQHFETVTLPDLSEPGSRKASTLKEMAEATVSQDAKNPPLQTKLVSLFNAALFGRKEPLPHAMLGQVIERQAVELAAGFNTKKKRAEAEKDWNSRLRHRAAFIRLFFNINQGKTMNEETILDEKCKDPAILCGRLLALLDKIHGEAHVQRDDEGKVVSKGTASSPANRFYRAASKTPALVFPRLLDLARDHLAKVDKDWAYRLEFGWQPQDSGNLQEPLDRPFIGLAGIVEQLKLKNRAEFPRLFSLEEQGRFALGFYYERCRRWPARKERQTNNNKESNKD
jgi:CRISPR-associated protein Csd1